MSAHPSAPSGATQNGVAQREAFAALRRPLPWIGAVFAVGATLAFGPRDLAAGAIVMTVAMSILLAFVDASVHRLPNRAVVPLWFGVVFWLTLAALIDGTWRQLLGALLGSVALGGVYLLLALIRAGAMGGGDVKFATALGLTAGWYGMHAWTWVLFVPFFVGGLAAVVGLASRRLTWTAHLPFGPAMALGYCLAVTIAF